MFGFISLLNVEGTVATFGSLWVLEVSPAPTPQTPDVTGKK